MTCNATQPVQRFLNPRAILFGICILNLLISLMFIRRVELQAQAARAAGQWSYSEHWNPLAVMWEPLLLFIAVVALIVNRWWSLLLALLVSGRVFYLLGYLSWRAIHFAHDVPMFSWQAIEKLWSVVYQPNPQYLIELVLSGLIFLYALTVITKQLFLRPASPITAD